MFLLTQHSFVFQIMSWNWKHLTYCKVQVKKVFWHLILHSYLCNALCTFFTKIESNLCFSKTYSEIDCTWSINSSKKLFFQMILYNYLYNSLCKFFIKIKSMWRHEIKEQTPKLTLLYYSRTVRSSYWRFSVKKLLLKILQYLQEMPVLESHFKKVAGLKICNFIKKRPQCRCFPVNIVKFLRLPILKNIFERLLFDSFNGSLLCGSKVSRSRIYDNIRQV